MTIIEVIGRVNEAGQLEYEQPVHLPPGEVRIIIETINAQEEADDDVLWDKQFANSPDTLDLLAHEAREEYHAGLTDNFDPDDDPDAP